MTPVNYSTLDFLPSDSDEESITDLSLTLQTRTEVTYLSFVKGELNAQQFNDLADILREKVLPIKRIDLLMNKIDNERLARLTPLLATHEECQSFAFGWNPITSSGAFHIAKAIEENHSLTELKLQFDCIDSEGACYLANALKINTTLTFLLLNHNPIKDAGARGFADALRVNSTLTELYLENCSIQDTGARDLAQMLEHNTSLRGLNLNYNSVTLVGSRALATSLQRNCTLTYIQLDGYHKSNIQLGSHLKSKNDATRFVADFNSLLQSNTTLTHIGFSGRYIESPFDYSFERNDWLEESKLSSLEPIIHSLSQ